MVLVLLFPFTLFAADGGSWYTDLLPGGVLAGVIVGLLDYVINKTDWIEAGSIGDIIVRFLVKIFKKDTKI